MHILIRPLAPLILLLAAACAAAPPTDTPNTSTPQPAGGTYGIAAANPLAAEAGRAMLARGGSAVDAAIAAQMVLTLVEPQSSGIGGGGFLLHHDAARGETVAYDGRETAPMAATPDLFLDADGQPLDFFEAVVGGRSVGAPGLLAMLETAHWAHGKLPWEELFQPAIELARDGFAVSPRLHELIAADPHLARYPAARDYFYLPDGSPLPVGHVLKNPALADTLRGIARDGAHVFYEGAIAEEIVAAVRDVPDNPGLLTLADLAQYRARVRAPVCIPYRGRTVCGMGPPSSGGVTVGMILGMLANFEPAADPMAPRALHLLAEASRLAFADRNCYLADTDFVDVPVAGLLDPGYLATRGARIDPGRAMDAALPGTPPRLPGPCLMAQSAELPSTSHLSVIDAEGNAVSFTTSIENVFGSRVMVRGFLLNNQLTDFSFAPAKPDGKPIANRVEPGKRPRSSMAPTLVFDAQGRLYAAVGSPGGSRIIGYVAQTLVGLIDGNLSMQAAIELPRVLNRNGPTEIEETEGADALAEALRGFGHEVETFSWPLSGLHGLVIRDGVITGGADPRREGVALIE